MRPLLYLPLALLAAGLFGLRAAAPPRGHDDAAHELVVLHPQRPYRVRLHLQLKGKAHDGDWNRVVEDLFRFLDADNNGVLSKAEAGRAPSREQWQQMSVGLPLEPDAGPDFAALAGSKTGASAADLKSWYRTSTAGPFQVGWGWRGRLTGALSDGLWRHLDTDRNGKLSPVELKAAAGVLDRLDVDEDELISQAEVMGFPQGGYFEPGATFTRGAAHGPAQGSLPFFSRRLDEPAAPLVAAVLARYGKPGAKSLGPGEFRLGKEPFAALDRDGDGRLDAAELARWAGGPPDAEVRVPLDPDGREPPTVVAKTAGIQARHEASRLRLVLGGWWLEIDGGFLPPVEVRRQKAGAARAAFQALDFDGNGYLDSQELYRPPFHHVALLRLADRDGDGKVTRKEFTDFAELRSRMQHGTTFLRVEDRGRSLFRVLDTDGDGRLGIRERLAVWKRLGGLAGPGGLVRDGLPQEYRITLAHGERPAEFDGAPNIQQRRRTAPPRGPVWFRKMDRNNDGDVSRAEWLGTAEQFRTIDSDGDGLLSPEEAWRADAWFRKPSR